MALESPAEGVYDTIEDLIVSVNKHAGSQGYAVVKCHSKRYPKDGLIHKVTLRCDRGGKYVKTVNDTYRKRWTTGTRLQECPF